MHYCQCGVKPTPTPKAPKAPPQRAVRREALASPRAQRPPPLQPPPISALRAFAAMFGFAAVLIGAIAAIYFVDDPAAARGLWSRAEDAYEDFTGAVPMPTATATPTPTATATPWSTATPAPTYTPRPTPVPFTAAAIERLVLELTNEARTAEGLAPLENDHALQKIARAHSKSMIIHGYTHYVGGLTPTDRANDANYPCYGIAENIHKLPQVRTWLIWPSGLREPSRLHDAEGIAAAFVEDLMESPGHRANILNPTHYKIGVGIAISDVESPVDVGSVFATQNFSPCS